ncbi:MAG: hypothetical protein PWP65_2166 [Clostridia bacterium]|nr:hypothetical protein [Clostridia bacterium]
MVPHYSRREWRLYKDELLPEGVRRAMEDHLRHCEACLENYLAAFGSQDETAAAGILSPDFSARVTSRVARMGARQKYKTGPGGNWLARAIQYYTIAAAVTLLLLAGGWFDFMVSEAMHSQVRVAIIAQTLEEKISLGWSERLFENATDKLTEIIDKEVAN